MDRALLAVTLASLVGLGAMAAVTAFTDPPRVALGDLDAHVGATITTTARILDIDVHDTGWTRLLLADGNHSVEATASTPPAASPGDVVDATGVVLRSGSRLRLQIDHPDDIYVRVAWQDNHQPLRRILERPWDHHDARLVTTGEYRVMGSSRFLEDQGQRVRVVGEGLDGWETGRRLRVEGWLEYDPETAAFRLRVAEARIA